MPKNSAQLDMFDPPVESLSPTEPSSPLPPEEPPPDEDAPPRSLCLFPSASFRECQACWEHHPDLWRRYITRANCVRHTR